MYKFNQNDIFFNTVTTYPKYSVIFYSGSAYINKQISEGPNKPAGVINLYETNNIVTASANWIPFQKNFSNGEVSLTPVTFSQGQMTASIGRSFILKSGNGYNTYYTSTSASFKILASSNTINYYRPLSQYFDTRYYLNTASVIVGNIPVPAPVPNYLPSSSTAQLNPNGDINIIEIPSVFYGRNINPGTIDLQFYVTGTLIARAQDTKLNGELIQTTGSTTGSVVGVALYNEGILLITGSSSLNSGVSDYYIQPTASGGTALANQPRWIYFGSYAKKDTSNGVVSSSYVLNFEGTEIVPTLTMMAHANKNDLNWSNNASYLESGSYNNYVVLTSSQTYIENTTLEIKNTVSSSFANYSASFQPQTFISSIGLYDEEGDLIGVATVANPVRKTNEQDYTFKLRLDL